MENVKRLRRVLFVVVVVFFGTVVNAALVAGFDMDSIGGDSRTITDITGNGHNALFNVDTTLSADNPFNLAASKSLQLTGSHVAHLSNPAPLSSVHSDQPYQDQWSMEMWFKPTMLGMDSWLMRTVQTNQTRGIYLNSDKTVDVRGNINGWQLAISTTKLETDKWYHIAAVYGSDLTFRLYINGVQEASVVIDSWYFATGIDATIGDLAVGLIDDVGFYNHALSVGELGYNASYTVPEPATIILFGISGLIALKRKKK